MDTIIDRKTPPNIVKNNEIHTKHCQVGVQNQINDHRFIVYVLELLLEKAHLSQQIIHLSTNSDFIC